MIVSLVQQIYIVPWTKIRHQLSVEVGLNAKQLDQFSSFLNLKGDLSEISTKLGNVIKDSKITKALADLKILSGYLQDMRLDLKIVFDPLLVFSHQYYDGMMFQFIKDGGSKQRVDVLAAGGRYDSLIEYFRHPTASIKKVYAIGISFSVTKLLSPTPVTVK